MILDMNKLKDGDVIISSIETHFDCLRIKKSLAEKGESILVTKSQEHAVGLAFLTKKYTTKG